MSEPNPPTPHDTESGAEADTDTVSAQKDAYDLYDRSSLYAKAEQSYSNKELSQEWARPASSSSEVGVDKIRDFDSFDDHMNRSMGSQQNLNDIYQGHPPRDRSCLPKDLDLSSLLMKERRMKRFLILLCFVLSIACVTLLACIPLKYRSDDESKNNPAARSSSGQSAYLGNKMNPYDSNELYQDIQIVDSGEVSPVYESETGLQTEREHYEFGYQVEGPLDQTTPVTDHWPALGIESRFRRLDRISQNSTKNDLALFWKIPKSGSELVQNVMMQCFQLTEASSNDANSNDFFLRLSSVTQPDAVITSQVRESSILFGTEQLGKCFVIMRNPIDRVIAVFNKLQVSNDGWPHADLESYAKSDYIENNWMTRELTGKLNGATLDLTDLVAAKEFLRKYCVVGVFDELGESIRQIANTFEWTAKDVAASDGYSQCVDTTLRQGLEKERSIQKIGIYVEKLLEDSIDYDMKLYNYAQELIKYRKDAFARKKFFP